MSRYGYARLNLEEVAREAGYTRGALYHQFANKEELAAAVVEWVKESWEDQVGRLIAEENDPVEALLAFARGHALYCRRDIARVMLALRMEFPDRSGGIGEAVADAIDEADNLLAERVAEAQERGRIPASPPAHDIARALTGAVEAVTIELAGRAPHDVELAERAVRGLLSLAGASRGGFRRRRE